MFSSGPSGCPTPERESGFTLVELLVALTIAGVSLSILAASVRTIALGREAIGERIETDDAMRRGITLLRRDLRGLLRSVRPIARESELVFEAGPTRLAFVSLQPPFPTAPGPAFVEYRIEQGPQGARLFRRTAKFVRGARAGNAAYGAQEEIVPPGVIARFSYLKSDATTRGWTPYWTSSRKLPAAIRFDPGMVWGRTFPQIIVPVRAEAEQNCIFEDSQVCTLETREAESRAINKGDPAQEQQ